MFRSRTAKGLGMPRQVSSSVHNDRCYFNLAGMQYACEWIGEGLVTIARWD